MTVYQGPKPRRSAPRCRFGTETPCRTEKRSLVSYSLGPESREGGWCRTGALTEEGADSDSSLIVKLKLPSDGE